MSTTHNLKTWPAPFSAVVSGAKRFEIRRNDRGFEVDHVLRLLEWDPDLGSYTGREFSARVTYLCAGGMWGLPADTCVMSIEKA